MNRHTFLSSLVVLGVILTLTGCQPRGEVKEEPVKEQTKQTSNTQISTLGETTETSTQESSQNNSTSKKQETKTTTTTTSSIEKTEVSSESNEKEESIKEDNVTWSNKKTEKLDTVMQEFGQQMDQSYTSYSPGENVKLYGLPLPEAAISQTNGWQMAVHEFPVTIAWGVDGEVRADYRLVGVYSDADHASYLNKHVYFFTIHEGKPVVLITMQNQGNPDNYIYFNETKNNWLKDAFEKLVYE